MDTNPTRATRKTHLILILGCMTVAVAGTVLAGCSSKDSGDEAPAVTVQVAAAESEKIQNVITADAIIYPHDQAAIVPKISAPVAKFYVDRGSAVHAGQLLAELENKDLAGAVTENQGGFQQADAAYQTALQNASQNLKLAQEQVAAAQKIYDNRQSLYKQGAASAKDVDDSRIALTQAQNQLALAQKQQDLRAAEGQLNAAKGRSASAEAQLGYTRITSPINGVITDRPVYPGEMAAAGAPILTVMDLSRVTARAHISQADASQLHVGDAATITVPGQAEGVPGKLTLVSPALDPSSSTVEVWVEAANPGNKLKAGASAQVSVVAKTVPKAVVIPAAALLTDSDGNTTVILLDSSNKPKKQKVKIGIRNGDDVQITDGLKADDRVVTTGAFELDREDADVLAKTKINVQAAGAADKDDEAGADDKKDKDDDKKDDDK